MGAKKDNVSLNTQQLLTMPKYSTYKRPIVSLDQTFDIDVNTNRVP
jgi:hypothetical protein